MKVLMFGWEFPPHITGGLGTACFGLTKGLLQHGVEVLFVVPKAYGDESQEAVRLLNASDVLVNMHNAEYQDFWSRITYMEIGSNLIPYVGPEEFENIVNKNLKDRTEILSPVFAEQFEFSGKYGQDLMAEVSRKGADAHPGVFVGNCAQLRERVVVAAIVDEDDLVIEVCQGVEHRPQVTVEQSDDLGFVVTGDDHGQEAGWLVPVWLAVRTPVGGRHESSTKGSVGCLDKGPGAL